MKLDLFHVLSPHCPWCSCSKTTSSHPPLALVGAYLDSDVDSEPLWRVHLIVCLDCLYFEARTQEYLEEDFEVYLESCAWRQVTLKYATPGQIGASIKEATIPQVQIGQHVAINVPSQSRVAAAHLFYNWAIPHIPCSKRKQNRQKL